MADTTTTDDAAQLDAASNITTHEPVTPETDDAGKGGKTAILADLARERDARQALEAELKAFREAEQAKADTEKSELEKAVERAERAEKAAQDAARKALAAEHGIPEGLLSGATPEEWQASADALLAFQQAGQQQRQVAPRAAGVQGNTGTPVAVTKITQAIAEAEAAGNVLASIALKQQLYAEQQSSRN